MRHPLCFACFFVLACNPTPDPTSGDAGPDVASECPPGAGAGTMHSGSIMTAETWTAAGSPHIVPSDMSIRAEVTLEACAVVRIGDSKSIGVLAAGTLVANGLPTRPVTIEPQTSGKPWSQIKVQQGGSLRLTHTRVVGGGAPLNAPLDVAAAIEIRGPDQTQPPGETFHADHVSIEDSASQGVSVREAGGFSATSTDLVIKGSKNVPIRTWASAAGSIPAGSYTGNAKDEIALEGGGLAAILRDQTFRERGVPYRVGDSIVFGELRVGGGKQVATLTIEPGVTVRFKKGGSMWVEYAQGTQPATGALSAVGTAEKPITFTSAEAAPAAGDWLGIHFNGTLDPKSRIDYARVEYAGMETSTVASGCKYPDNKNNAAAIRVFVEPTSVFITHTTVVASARSGIDRGWLGTSSISFVGSNDLSGAAMCKETFPQPNGGPCPMPVPCP